MGNKCKVCFSEHRAEYEDLRLNKKLKLLEIAQIAKNKYGEELSCSALSRHFTNCVEPYLDASIRSGKLKDIYVKAKLRESIDASINIIKTINMLKTQLEVAGEDVSDPDNRREVRDIAKILDSVMRTALQFSDKLKPENDSSNDDVYDRLLWSLEKSEVPVEYIKKIKEYWDSYGKDIV